MKAFWKYAVVMMLALLAIALVASPALGQCAMCRASLGGGNATFIRHLNIGVAVLLLPPVSMFCTIFIVAMKRRKSN
jgi:hypothetical protein